MASVHCQHSPNVNWTDAEAPAVLKTITPTEKLVVRALLDAAVQEMGIR